MGVTLKPRCPTLPLGDEQILSGNCELPRASCPFFYVRYHQKIRVVDPYHSVDGISLLHAHCCPAILFALLAYLCVALLDPLYQKSLARRLIPFSSFQSSLCLPCVCLSTGSLRAKVCRQILLFVKWRSFDFSLSHVRIFYSMT